MPRSVRGATILINVRRFAFFAVAVMAMESVASAAPSDESTAPGAPAAPSDAVTAPTEAVPAPSDKAAAPSDTAAPAKTEAAPATAPAAAPSEAPAAPPPAPTEAPGATAPATATGTAEVAETNESWKLDSNQKTRLPWHGTVLLFDQSVTTTTVGIGRDYQSYDPVYELWWAFKPRYSLYESKLESFSLGMWFNLYLELTNSDTTTKEHELLIGPTWLTATYARTLYESGSYKTSFNVGPRLGLPTAKSQRDAGQIMALGAVAGLSQRVPVAGKDAFWFSKAGFGLTGTYGHPINKANVPVNGDLDALRSSLQAASRTVVSDVLSGTLNVADLFNVALSGSIQIIPDLDFNLSYSFLYSWVAGPTNACVETLTGCVTPMSVEDPSTFRASNWLVFSLDYDLSDSFTLSTGYYNLTSQLGANSKLRQPLMSPDSRFYFTIIANLDAIYENLSGKSSPPPPKATAHR